MQGGERRWNLAFNTRTRELPWCLYIQSDCSVIALYCCYGKLSFFRSFSPHIKTQTLQELVRLASTLSIPMEDAPPSSEDMETDPSTHTQARLQAIERTAKSSLLGCILQPLLVVVSNPAVCTLQMANTLQRNISTLAQLTAQVLVM